MIQVAIFDVKPTKVDRLKSWMAELQERRDEVIRTFHQETVSHEVAYLIQGSEGPVLMYVVEVEDPEAAREAFRTSVLPIDRQHKDIMDDVLGERAEAELLYDVRVD